MAVKIRLARIGKTGHALYRLVAIEEGKKRDGRALETLGHFDPHKTVKSEKLKVKSDRLNYWVSVGAKPTETVRNLLENLKLKT